MKRIVTVFVVFLFICVSGAGALNIRMNSYESDVIGSGESASDGGLMDSAWPMFHHDARHTGLSPNGRSGNWFVVKWKFSMDGMVTSSPVIDNNGTIYIGSTPSKPTDYLYAINPDGTKKWGFKECGWIHSSPAIAEDGTIYVGSDDGNLYSIHPNGILRWKFGTGGSWVFSSPAIGNDGTIYFGSTSNNFYALNPNGTIKWLFPTGNSIFSSVAIDENGIIYFGSHDNYVYALYPNGTLKWRFGTGDCVKSPPSIGDDGTVYVCSWDHYLYAINPDGTEKWRFDTGDAAETSPALAADGSIYVGSYNGRVFSISLSGTENWRFETGDWVLSSPAIDKYGVIYVGSLDGNLYALNPDGTLRWKFNTGGEIVPSPAVGEDGTIYVGAHDTSQPDFYAYLYAIEPIDDNPPEKPSVNGSLKGSPGKEFTYTATSNDPNSDDISYYFDWGDGTNSDWTEYISSGIPVSRSHSWDWWGTYTIKVKAKDIYNMEGDWGTLIVTMPRSKATNINTIFLELLEKLPLLERLLYLIK
jgi:outer membrane protein assembly factor BamB